MIVDSSLPGRCIVQPYGCEEFRSFKLNTEDRDGMFL
jgi:hypothetical protein